MMKLSTIPLLLLLCTACGVTPQTPEAAKKYAARIEKARALLAAGDPDEALLITDKLLEEDTGLRDARLIAAEANIALVDKGRGSITASFIEDAIRHYDRALRQDENDAKTWGQLADAYRLKGDYQSGADAALEAAKIYKGRDPEAFSRELIRAAENELMIFKVARNEELQSEDKELRPETAVKARKVLERLEAVKQLNPGEGYMKAAEVYRWLGRGHEELDSLERGIRANKEHFPIHQRYRELRAQRGEQAQCVAFYRAELRDEGMNAAMAYSLGMAESALGDKHRAGGNREAAEKAYNAAIQSFERCLRNRGDWKDNCNHWLAIEHLSLAALHLEAGSHGKAADQLEKAYRRTPKVTERDANNIPVVMDSFRTYYFGTMLRIGGAVQSGGTKDSLRDGLAFWERFIKLHPEEYGWMYNNAALNARDLGAAIESGAAKSETPEATKAEAMKLYERSYELYDVAARLDPNDARTVNDCGLMLIYHLKRDYPKAERLFRQAIEVGEKALAELPEDTSVEDRNLAEEAVGDAYQNVGKLYMDQGQPFEKYAPDLRKSLLFYPKNRRQSALWLRRGSAPAAMKKDQPAATDPRSKEFAAVEKAAAARAKEKDYDGALLELDKVASKMIGYAPYHFLQGLYSLRYAQQAVQRGGTAGQIDGLFADARNNLQKAVELDGEPIEPRLRLAEANYESGEIENASKIATALILHISSRGGTTEELLAETQRVRAMAGTRAYIASKKLESPNPGELLAARNAFRNLEKMGKLTAVDRKPWSDLEQWAGNLGGALEIFERAADKTPDQATLGQLVETARTTKQSARAAAFLAKKDDALSTWYRGMALYYSAYETPASESVTATEAAIDQAIESFEAAADRAPAYRPSCNNWIAVCNGSAGFMALARKEYSNAETRFIAAAKRAPAQINAPISANRSVKTGVQLIVHAHFTAKDLPAAIATLEKAAAAMPGEADIWNNLGLFARDHGTALERQGKTDAAKAHYEKSFGAYQKAVALEPTSVRQRNDLVVMQLYHLNRDMDQVVPTLEACVRDGEKQLAENPPEDEQELRDLQEAVGDSYENLGYYAMKFGNDVAAARKNFEKSREFYPFKRRQSTRYLRQLDRQDK